MQLAALILLCVLVAIAVGVATVLIAPHVATHRGRRVIINLRSGPSLTGVLARQIGGRIELTDARLHEAGTDRPLDGRAVAFKGNVAFVQVLAPIDPDSRT